jgi:tRNA pseudouridine38-40 synthase
MRRTCDSRVYEYLLPTYCLLPPASDDALAQHLDKSSPGWREGLGEAAAFADAGIKDEETAVVTEEKADEAEAKAEDGQNAAPVEGDDETRGKFGPKKAGEFERRREWRCDEATLGRFRALIKEFVGTQ